MPKVIELFAGAGGLALGLEKAGFKSKGLIEKDKSSCQTLTRNKPKWNVIQENIEELSKKNLESYFDIDKGELDLLSGGYPCQSFSYAGKGKGLGDPRGTLFHHYAIFLEKLMPKMFLAENVKGLLSHDKGQTLKTMIKVFSDIGYQIEYKVLNAWDYGVPQKRQRIFIIGIRNDLVDKVSFSFPKERDYKPVLKDVIKDVPLSDGAKYPNSKKEVLDLVPQGGCWVNLPDDIARKYMKKSYFSKGGRRGIARRLSWEEPSLTLTTSPQQKQTERCHPEETRPLTVREYARIQTFPDNWVFEGSITNRYKQIGNAVPVNLAYEIGRQICISLRNA
jgi:DNA (cytosine-5)-methyltransferase 1